MMLNSDIELWSNIVEDTMMCLGMKDGFLIVIKSF